MSNIAIVGYNGFVGNFINEKIPHSDNYNSSNIQYIKNKKYDAIYFAGLPAQKWLINQNAQKDLDNINEIITCLSTVECKIFYLFSTIDIYDRDNPKEITKEPYGINRYYFEQFISSRYKNYRIIRLPALFGLGLKKNLIYDIINSNQIEKINTNVDYQWYNMHDLWDDINVLPNINGTFDFFSTPISTKIIVKDCFGNDKLQQLEKNNFINKSKSYNIETFSTAQGTRNIINKIKKFVAVNKHKNQNNISVSCLMWKKEDEDKILYLLEKYGIKKVEIAPTRYFKWDSDDTTIKNQTKHLTDSGIEFYSMQSLFNGIDANLFDSNDKFIDHFKRIKDIALFLGTKRLVYGSPTTRHIKDGSNYDEIFIETFQKISEIFSDTDIIVCIEPNSRTYGCNYLYNFDQTNTIVDKINMPNIKINFDSGNAIMENDEEYKIINNLNKVYHAHISKPNLSYVGNIDYLRTFKKLICNMPINIEAKEIDFSLISNILYEIISELYGEKQT